MTQIPILTSIIVMQLLGVLVTLLIRAEDAHVVNQNSRNVGIFASTITLVMALFLMRTTAAGDGFTPQLEVWSFGGMSRVGVILSVDQVSLVLLLLSSFLFFVIHISDEMKAFRQREYVVALLLTQAIVTAFWCVQSVMTFYILFEMALVPLFYMIGIWGGKKRMDAAFKFMLITALGSFLFLFALLKIYDTYGTFNFSELRLLMRNQPPHPYIWWGMMAAFAIKTPMLGVHAWLPRAHVEAPTSASMILAGILLKFGAFGMFRCLVFLLPEMTLQFAEPMRWLSVAAIFYASAAAFVQNDMKRMIAYTSVAHMGIVSLGIFSLNPLGFEGAFFQMISHGVITPALFFGVSLIQRYTSTRNLSQLSGLAVKLPITVGCMGVFVFALIGFPGTSGFVGEILVFLGAIPHSLACVLVAASGIVFSSAYGLKILKHIGFGAYKVPDSARFYPLHLADKATLYCFVVLIVWLGVFPEHLRGYTRPALHALLPRAAQVVALEGSAQ